MPNICHEILVAATAETIYNAITTQEGLSAWWTPETNARADVNTIARFGFGPKYFKEMKVIELKSPLRVKWVCVTGADEWVGTSVSFELHEGDKQTLLTSHAEMADQIAQQIADRGTVIVFRHDNWKEYTPMFAECNYTWAQFLRSLKLFCETGMGRPWPSQHCTER